MSAVIGLLLLCAAVLTIIWHADMAHEQRKAKTCTHDAESLLDFREYVRHQAFCAAEAARRKAGQR